MKQEYEVYYRDARKVACGMIANPDFKTEIDFAPFRDYDENGQRQFQDLMSGNWAWRQAVCIPIILSSNEFTLIYGY